MNIFCFVDVPPSFRHNNRRFMCASVVPPKCGQISSYTPLSAFLWTIKRPMSYRFLPYEKNLRRILVDLRRQKNVSPAFQISTAENVEFWYFG